MMRLKVPESLPLEAHLAIDDLQKTLAEVEAELNKDMDYLEYLESKTDLTNEESFKKYERVRSKLKIFGEYVEVSVLTVERLAEYAGKSPVDLLVYAQLEAENQLLKNTLRGSGIL